MTSRGGISLTCCTRWRRRTPRWWSAAAAGGTGWRPASPSPGREEPAAAASRGGAPGRPSQARGSPPPGSGSEPAAAGSGYGKSKMRGRWEQSWPELHRSRIKKTCQPYWVLSLGGPACISLWGWSRNTNASKTNGMARLENVKLTTHFCTFTTATKKLGAGEINFNLLIPFFFAFPVALAILWDIWIPLLK